MKPLAFLVQMAFVAGLMWVSKQQAPTAKADLLDSQGKSVGTATLVQEKGGVRIAIKATGLAPGLHGFHVHETGACHGPDFATSGGHFNPFGRKHGLDNPEGPHAGDLPNVRVGDDGTLETSVLAPLVTLAEGKPNSLLRRGGTCLVLHAGPDDGRSDPAGNSGARLACGVIRPVASE